MSTATKARSSIYTTMRAGFGIGGLLAVIIGILILVAPKATALAVTQLVAIWAIIGGVIHLGLAAFAKDRPTTARIGHGVLGVLFVIAGILALVNLGATTLWLATFVGVAVGILWIVEGVVAMTTLGERGSNRVWTIVFAVLSIIAGAVLVFSPLLGAVVLWWLLGISLVVLGVLQILRAFTYGKSAGR